MTSIEWVWGTPCGNKIQKYAQIIGLPPSRHVPLEKLKVLQNILKQL